MDESTVHTALGWVLLFSSIGVAIAEQIGIKAPYGKFVIKSDSKEANGCLAKLNARSVNPRLAWAVMESPCSILLAAGLFVIGSTASVRSAPNLLLCAMFGVHYINRAFVYPFRLSASTAPVPIFIAANGFLFCVLNGYLQSRALTYFYVYPSEWLTDPRFIAGTALFAAGLALNFHSDHILRSLRRSGEPAGTYKIPRGGLFEYVSTANYTGEIIEWFGFALACWSFMAFVFAAFTLLHLGARAIQNHHWLISKFGSDYPPSRKMVIPFIY